MENIMDTFNRVNNVNMKGMNAMNETGYIDTDTAIENALVQSSVSELSEDTTINAIINGEVTTEFNIITMSGDFSAREAYALTRPDDDNAISIGKNAKNEIIEIDKYILYNFMNNGKPKLGIVILGKNGKKYVTTSTYFIKEFVILDRLYKMDGVTLDTIQVIYKESQNRTADGQKMTYPLPIGM